MKKLILFSAILTLTLSLNSCRETEMNTDGNMEEQETRQDAVETNS